MIDARGLSCPLPVVMVKKEVDKNQPTELDVQVDAMVCVENVTRYAHSQGYEVNVEELDEEYTLHLKK